MNPQSTNEDELREKIATIIDEAVIDCADSLLCSVRSDYAGNTPYKSVDKIMQLIAQTKAALIEKLMAGAKTFERLTGEKPSGEFEKAITVSHVKAVMEEES